MIHSSSLILRSRRGNTLTSATSRSMSNAGSGIGWLTKTLGLTAHLHDRFGLRDARSNAASGARATIGNGHWPAKPTRYDEHGISGARAEPGAGRRRVLRQYFLASGSADPVPVSRTHRVQSGRDRARGRPLQPHHGAGRT